MKEYQLTLDNGVVWEIDLESMHLTETMAVQIIKDNEPEYSNLAFDIHLRGADGEWHLELHSDGDEASSIVW